MARDVDSDGLVIPIDGETRRRLDRFSARTGMTTPAAAASLLHHLLDDAAFWSAAADPAERRARN